MDDFINTINKNDIKNDSKTSPAKAFIQFCDKHSEAIKEQVESLTNEENMTEKDINDKLKKTFKNRYFQKLKKSSN